MWNYLLLSAIVTLISLLFRHNLTTPLSIVEHPDADYDYVVGRIHDIHENRKSIVDNSAEKIECRVSSIGYRQSKEKKRTFNSENRWFDGDNRSAIIDNRELRSRTWSQQHYRFSFWSFRLSIAHARLLYTAGFTNFGDRFFIYERGYRFDETLVFQRCAARYKCDSTSRKLLIDGDVPGEFLSLLVYSS